MTKVLVSRGYGAGWSTWNDSRKRKQVAEYKPIIDFLEAGGNPNDLDTNSFRADKIKQKEKYHPLVRQMIDDLGLDDYFYTGGAGGLEIEDVSGSYCIEEYDGYESVITANCFWE